VLGLPETGGQDGAAGREPADLEALLLHALTLADRAQVLAHDVAPGGVLPSC
jgi:hypothetical protein